MAMKKEGYTDKEIHSLILFPFVTAHDAIDKLVKESDGYCIVATHMGRGHDLGFFKGNKGRLRA